MSRTIIVSRHPAEVEFIRRHLSGDRVEYRLFNYPEAQKAATPGSPGSRYCDVLRPWPVPGSGCPREETDRMYGVPVYTNVEAEDVLGAVVYGNLPMHLATLARRVYAIKFTDTPPRGQKYSVEDMLKAGAVLKPYSVCRGEHIAVDPHELFRLGKLLAKVAEGKVNTGVLDYAGHWAKQIQDAESHYDQ